jgi:hypothetical protein
MAGSDVNELSCWDDWLAKTVKEVVKGVGIKILQRLEQFLLLLIMF